MAPEPSAGLPPLRSPSHTAAEVGHRLPLRAPAVVVAPQLLDLQAVAARLALGVRTVRYLVSRGELPAVRIGRALRFTEVDVARFIERSRIGGAA